MMAYSLRNLFVLNERVALIGSWKHGMFSMTAVGATNVGTIVVNCAPNLKTNLPEHHFERPLGTYLEEEHPDEHLLTKRGDELGGFRLGSTIVLVFEAPEKFSFAVEQGQKIKLGQKLGN
jgi:phosphatidylserine decarboxylase